MMGSLFLVDTSVWIFALRRSPHEAIRHRIAELLEMDTVATCGLVVLELLGGTANEGEFARLQQRLQGLHRLETREADWEEAARLAFSTRHAGIAVPFTDLLLSALAMRHDAVLLHADRDFDLVARHCDLMVESHVAAVSQQ